MLALPADRTAGQGLSRSFQSTSSRSCALLEDDIGVRQLRGRERAGGHRDAAHPVGARAGDVARRVADDHRLRARVAARAGAGDGGQLGAVLVVGAEAALAVLEEARRGRRARA